VPQATKPTLYLLVRTVEADIPLSGDTFRLRIDILKALDTAQTYRARFWRLEDYTLQSSFPLNESGEPLHGPSHEGLLVDCAYQLGLDDSEFDAASPEAAMDMMIRAVLKWWGGSPGSPTDLRPDGSPTGSSSGGR
jgi:hypothetical protein